MALSEDFRHLEAERRDIKRSEIRLNHGLRNLEEARLAYLNSISKEKKQLQQELQRLHKSNSKQKLPLSTGHTGINTALPRLSPQTERDKGSRDAARQRKFLPKPGGPSNTGQSPSQPNSSHISCHEDGKGHLPPLKDKGQVTAADSEVAALKNTIAKQLSISAEPTEEGESNNGQGKGLGVEETRDGAGSKAPTIKLMNLPGKRRLSLVHERPILDAEAYAADGDLRTMYFRPDFLKSYAAARKFRYIRHKSIPAWEKELSLQEIFGHKTSVEHCPQAQHPKP